MAIAFEVVNESELTISYQLADQSFSLPPRVIRTHEGCGTLTLKFMPFATTEDLDSADPVETFTANGGARYTVTSTESGYDVSVDEIEELLTEA